MGEYLNAHSVMLASEREKTPHYFEVTDSELDVEYQVYLSKKGPDYVHLWRSLVFFHEH